MAMSVSWAWARSRFHRTRSSGSSGGSSYGSSFASGSSRASFQGNDTFQSNVSTNGTSRPSKLRHHIRAWSRPAVLDDVIIELDTQRSDCEVLIHTEDRGYTEHVNNVAAIEYLRCLARERRQPKLPLGHRKPSLSMPAVRRRPRSSGPSPLVVDEKEYSGMKKCATVTGALSDALARIPSSIVEDEREVALSAKLCSAEVSSDAETCLPSDDERKPEVDERLRDLQLVLDAASPSEFVGLSVILGGDHGIVKVYTPEGGFVVALKSGADVSLARIEASHVLECLPEWA